MWLPESESYAGSVTQVRDCTQALMEYSKRTGCATFIVGHVTKDGAIAGPRLLEHLVDTVLYFEGDTTGEYRILRAYKNRFGSIDEICVFCDARFAACTRSPIRRSSSCRSAAQRPSGSCVVASIVGSRPVLVEVQALVGETSYGTPRRLANNLDQQRLAMILAVLERRAGMQLGTHDVYASVAGGLRVTEPAADLGIALAIASSFRNVAIPAAVAVFGELGLSGEVRAVGAADRREAEARKLGYTQLISPANAARRHRRDRKKRWLVSVRDRSESFRGARRANDRRAVKVAETAGAHVLHRSSDAAAPSQRSHDRRRRRRRSLDAAVALAGVALERIDLRAHRGVHPRIGALDVLPFVPLRGATLEEAAALAHRAGAGSGSASHSFLLLRRRGAQRRQRRLLPSIRRNDRLAARRRRRRPARSAGAIAIGARDILIAFNVELAPPNFRRPGDRARDPRTRRGPALLARPRLPPRDDRVQVSLNVTDYAATPLYRVVELIRSSPPNAASSCSAAN